MLSIIIFMEKHTQTWMYSLPLSLHHWFLVQTWHWEASSCFCWTGPSGGWVSSWSPPDASEWWSSVGVWSRHLLLRSSRRPRSLSPGGWSSKVTIWFINAKFMNFLFHDGYNFVHYLGLLLGAAGTVYNNCQDRSWNS